MSTTQPEALAALIERLRLLPIDHEPDGWPAVRTRDITALLDRIAELEARVQEMGQMARDVNSRRVVELESELAAMRALGEPVAEMVPYHTPSGKRVAVISRFQHLPIGTKLYTYQPAAQDAERKRWIEIGQAIERACMTLPEGAEVILSLERDAGTVKWFDGDGNEYDTESHEDGLAGVINDAIDAAIAAQQGEKT